MEKSEVRERLEAHIPGLHKALQQGGGTHSVMHVLSAIADGSAQVWLEGDACIVTEVNDTPNVRVLHFWLATGTLGDVIALSNKVMEWGRENGCEVASLTGRRGWLRALTSEGWEPHSIEMVRRLDG